LGRSSLRNSEQVNDAQLEIRNSEQLLELDHTPTGGNGNRFRDVELDEDTLEMYLSVVCIET
jgi:hypothetical protein